jgi:hypothetical protein
MSRVIRGSVEAYSNYIHVGEIGGKPAYINPEKWDKFPAIFDDDTEGSGSYIKYVYLIIRCGGNVLINPEEYSAFPQMTVENKHCSGVENHLIECCANISSKFGISLTGYEISVKKYNRPLTVSLSGFSMKAKIYVGIVNIPNLTPPTSMELISERHLHDVAKNSMILEMLNL